MKQYTLTRIPSGTLELRAQAEVYDKDKKGRTVGSHIETETTSSGYDSGNASDQTKALAAAIVNHYMGAANDPGVAVEAQHRIKPFMEAFLLHHQMPLGARLEISSNVLDNFFATVQA